MGLRKAKARCRRPQAPRPAPQLGAPWSRAPAVAVPAEGPAQRWRRVAAPALGVAASRPWRLSRGLRARSVRLRVPPRTGLTSPGSSALPRRPRCGDTPRPGGGTGSSVARSWCRRWGRPGPAAVASDRRAAADPRRVAAGYSSGLFRRWRRARTIPELSPAQARDIRALTAPRRARTRVSRHAQARMIYPTPMTGGATFLLI